MRKDIQFGLTIGGLLLAVLVIYLAVFSHSAKKPQDLALVQGPATQPIATGQGAPTDLTESKPAPLDVSAPTRIDTAAVATSTTQPAGETAASTSSTAHDWTALLQTGNPTTQPVAMSASPVTDQGGTSTEGATAPAAAQSPLASATTSQTHKVAAGESFYTIAKAVYGDSRYFNKLVDANPTIQANRLKIGMVINVPALDAATPLSATTSAKMDDTAAAKPAADTSLPVTATLDPSKSYRVKPSDTLMAIARRLYGDGQAWEKIYDANRDSIGPNPARLKVDMVLRLPEAPNVAIAN